MKIITLSLLITFSTYSQTATYDKINKQQDFKEYISKDNLLLKIGDTLTIGYPFSGSFFTFITQGGQQTSPMLSNKKIAIKKIKTIGTKKTGFKTYFTIAGYGFVPVYIDYESALETGEIKKPN